MLDTTKMVVLVVDDDSLSLNSVTYNLQIAGYQVVTAINGAQAIDVLKSRPDITTIVSDIEMPEVDGYGLLQFVQTMPKKPLFFFMTAHMDQSEWTAVEAGADGLFYKPFDGGRLTIKLSILRNRRAE